MIICETIIFTYISYVSENYVRMNDNAFFDCTCYPVHQNWLGIEGICLKRFVNLEYLKEVMFENVGLQGNAEDSTALRFMSFSSTHCKIESFHTIHYRKIAS